MLSEARTQTQFLDSPALREVLTKSSFRLDGAQGREAAQRVPVPARAAHGHARPLAARDHQSGRSGALEPRRSDPKDKDKPPVLLLLEEFPVLKHMEKLEAAAGQLAGSGVKLWVIVQNLGQLKRHYKDGWETFIANAGVITAFGNADLETLDYVSKKLGKVGDAGGARLRRVFVGASRRRAPRRRRTCANGRCSIPTRPSSSSRARSCACWCWRRDARRCCCGGRSIGAIRVSRGCSTRDGMAGLVGLRVRRCNSSGM